MTKDEIVDTLNDLIQITEDSHEVTKGIASRLKTLRSRI
jgi:hypothetical protein